MRAIKNCTSVYDGGLSVEGDEAIGAGDAHQREIRSGADFHESGTMLQET